MRCFIFSRNTLDTSVMRRFQAACLISGEYPGMISADDTGRVLGELYEFDQASWEHVIAQLDEYEGCSPADPQPHEYRREIVSARLANGEILPAWAYVLNGWPAAVREIKSGDYLAWRARA